MKKNVLDINDLQELIPLFRGRIGTFLGKYLLSVFCVNRINAVYGRWAYLKGVHFTSAVLKDPSIDVQYNVHHKKILNELPEGAFVTVSNHPVGSIDGVVLIDLFASLRPDFKVMVNDMLVRIGAMEDNFISVQPGLNRQGTNPKNINGLRDSLRYLKEGHPVGFFPAGAISSYCKDTKKVCDRPWINSIIRLIRKANVPVCPVYFDFYNSRFFYWLSSFGWQIRSLRIPAEVFNKRGRTLDVYIGRIIPAETIQSITNTDELAHFLLQRTYGAKTIDNE